MKVLVISPTGSSKLEALLDKDSGIIEYKTGEVSHIAFEKNMGKAVFVVKDEPKEKLVEDTSTEQSKPVTPKANKRKSN
jgi:hypothetical protein